MWKKNVIIFVGAAIVMTGLPSLQTKVSANTTQAAYERYISNAKSTTNKKKKDEKTEPIYMEEPPVKYYCSKSCKSKKVKPYKLTVQSAKTNKITDTDQWFFDIQLTRRHYQVSEYVQYETDEILPEDVPTTKYDLILTNAFYDDSFVYCTYGAEYGDGYMLDIYDIKTMKCIYSFDFSTYRYSPDYVKEEYEFIQQRINYAVIKDDILYISSGHYTYATSSKNMNAYITAISLSDNSILWRTDALVSNAGNFVIYGDVIISGYGFTDEDDYLYQINRTNGKVIDSKKVKTAPEHIFLKNKKLYVRTYNTNYVFKMKSTK